MHKSNNKNVSKKLQTKIQALIAYGCYDSNQVLKAGDSMTKKDIIQRIRDLFMPKIDNEDSLSHVESFLEGKGKYCHLFDRLNNDGDSSDVVLTIPENMHCMVGKTVTLGAGGVDKSLLTQKNLLNWLLSRCIQWQLNEGAIHSLDSWCQRNIRLNGRDAAIFWTVQFLFDSFFEQKLGIQFLFKRR